MAFEKRRFRWDPIEEDPPQVVIFDHIKACMEDEVKRSSDEIKLEVEVFLHRVYLLAVSGDGGDVYGYTNYMVGGVRARVLDAVFRALNNRKHVTRVLVFQYNL